MSGCAKFPPGNRKGIQIGTGKHGVQTILVSLQSTISRFPISKLTLNNSKCVLYLTAHRGLAVLNISLPVDCIIRNVRQFPGTAVNTVVNTGKMLIAGYLGTLLDYQIA